MDKDLAFDLLNCPGFKLYEDEMERLKTEILTDPVLHATLPHKIYAYQQFAGFKSSLINEVNKPNPERDGK